MTSTIKPKYPDWLGKKYVCLALLWLTTEMWEQGGCENSTGMPTPAKTTLNVLYRLTTEMGEEGGCENSTGMPTPAKTTLNVL